MHIEASDLKFVRYLAFNRNEIAWLKIGFQIHKGLHSG